MTSLYTVRHVEWDNSRKVPKGAAYEQVAAARSALAEVLGVGAVLLSSRAERALWTAYNIAADTGALVVPSIRIEKGGNLPGGIGSLDAFVATALREAEIELGGPLVVVTHEPLMKIINKGQSVGYGQVIPYEAEGWENPDFHPLLANRLEEDIAATGAQQP